MAKNTNRVTINADGSWQAVSTGVKEILIDLYGQIPVGASIQVASAAVVGDLNYTTDYGHELSLRRPQLRFTPGAPVFAKVVGGVQAGVNIKLIVTQAI